MFCAQISVYEFIAEHTLKTNNHSIYDVILVNSEESLKKIPEEQLEKIYQFSYLFCIEMIDFLLKKEDELLLNNGELKFLKEAEMIGAIREYVSNSINQKAAALFNQISKKNTASKLEIYHKIRRICVLLNRLSSRLLNVVFDTKNESKPARVITINTIWERYDRQRLACKQKETIKLKKYSKICDENDKLIIYAHQINDIPNNHQEIIDLTKRLIKSMRILSKYG
jgi:hypothetical protein